MALVGYHSNPAFKLASHMDFATLGIAFVKFIVERIRSISTREAATANSTGPSPSYCTGRGR
jgi:hypothetical protein